LSLIRLPFRQLRQNPCTIILNSSKKFYHNHLKTLVLENSLKLGSSPKYTNKKVTQYLFGTRNNVEFFKIIELRQLLLRLYPLLHTLFFPSLPKLKLQKIRVNVSNTTKQINYTNIIKHKKRKHNSEPSKKIYRLNIKSSTKSIKNSTNKNHKYKFLKNFNKAKFKPLIKTKNIKKDINKVQNVKNKRSKKNLFFFLYKYKKNKKLMPPKILFVTINTTYTQIIKEAASICRMPFHTGQ
jgi:hypothetical protein